MASETVAVNELPDVPKQQAAAAAPAGDEAAADEGEPLNSTKPAAVVPPKLGIELEDAPLCSAERWLNKGNVSNAITFVIMIIFIILKISDDANLAIDYGLAFGLFGFAVRSLSLAAPRRLYASLCHMTVAPCPQGGVTNWLAVTMLFDKVPLLIGSGVIPRHFKAISRASTEKFIDMVREGMSALGPH
jgi:hypothetical protein